MNIEIFSIMFAAVSAPLGAWLGSVLQRDKYRAEVAKAKAEAGAVEIENVRKSNEMLSERVEELTKETQDQRKETNNLRRDVRKLQKAIEKISLCPHAADCPVSRELQNGAERDEAGGDAGSRG